jgi:glutamine phosphoribosylpyrophosphate amidotransferase
MDSLVRHDLTEAEVNAMLDADRAKYQSVSDMARAWGLRVSIMQRILQERRLRGHVAQRFGLQPITTTIYRRK